jgi:hypothetical protein
VNLVAKMNLVATQEFLSSLDGLKITHGEIGDTGIHFFLDDGRVMILEGPCILYIWNPKEQSIH